MFFVKKAFYAIPEHRDPLLRQCLDNLESAMSSFRPTTASSNDLVLFRYWCKALIALPAAEIPDRMEPFLEYMHWMLGSLRRIPLGDIVAFAKDWLWALQGFGSRIFQLFRDFTASPIKDMFQKFLVPSLVARSVA